MFRRDRWWLRELERMERAHAAERATLVAAVAHLAGRALPSNEPPPPPAAPDPDAGRYVLVPEQLPEQEWDE